MAYDKKTWANRQSEFPNRRRMAATGTAEVYEIERAEGLVVEEGDAFDQATMNALETRVATAFEQLANGAQKAGKAALADNATAAYGKAEGSLRVSYAATAGSAGTANTANSANIAYGKAEAALNVNYAGTANYANSASNADMVDGFHVAGKGTGAPGALAENALYFVYE